MLNEKLSKESLLCYVTQEQIFEKYLGFGVDLNRKFKNPFREDKQADCSFYYNSNGTLFFTDFACKSCGGDCFSICQLYYGCDFYTALRHINRDFKVGLYDGHIWDESIVINRQPVERTVIQPIEKRRADIRYSWMAFTEHDLEYWKQFGISLKTLDKFDVKCAFKVWINGMLYHQYSFKDPMYVYPFDDLCQVYRPLAKKSYKWRTNTNRSCLHGYKQLPLKGKDLFITSSRKDVMCLDSIGFNTIAPPSEGTVPDELLLAELQERFENIYMFYDSDKPGREYSNKMTKIMKVKKELFTIIGKDPAEMCYLSSPEKLKLFINDQISAD